MRRQVAPMACRYLRHCRALSWMSCTSANPGPVEPMSKCGPAPAAALPTPCRTDTPDPPPTPAASPPDGSAGSLPRDPVRRGSGSRPGAGGAARAVGRGDRVKERAGHGQGFDVGCQCNEPSPVYILHRIILGQMLSTQRSQWNMAARWSRPTPTSADSQDSNGCIHCALEGYCRHSILLPEYAVCVRQQSKSKLDGDRQARQVNGTASKLQRTMRDEGRQQWREPPDGRRK